MATNTTQNYQLRHPTDDERVAVPTHLRNLANDVDLALAGLADGVADAQEQASSTTGKSAYQSWKDQGNVGTEAEFVAALYGASAYQHALDEGFTGTLTEWLASLNGADGVDAYDLWLAAGNTGTVDDYLAAMRGATGPGAYQAWLDGGNTGTEADFIATLKGDPGQDGDPGADGADGVGVPAGGTAGQILGKVSAADHDTSWIDPPSGGGTSGASTLDELMDVDLTTDPALDGEVLVKRGAHWVPEPMAASTGGATTLDALTDVDTAGGSAGQALVLGNDGQWRPATIATGGGTTPPAQTATVGNTTGSDSGTNYLSATQDIVVRKAMKLTALGFHPVSTGTHKLTINGTQVATVSATAGVTATFTGLDQALGAGTHRFAIARQDGVSAKQRFSTIHTIAHLGEFYDFSTGKWVEFTTGSYGLPWIYTIEAIPSAAGPGSINDLTDVDTATTAPSNGQALLWNGTNWVPGAVSTGTAPAPATEVIGILVIPNGGVVPNTTPEGTIIFERTA